MEAEEETGDPVFARIEHNERCEDSEIYICERMYWDNLTGDQRDSLLIERLRDTDTVTISIIIPHQASERAK
jgi:hypothetical protein